MSIEENKVIAHCLYEEVYNKGKLASLDDLMSTSYVDHNPLVHGQAPDREGAKQGLSTLRTALPDLYITIEDMVAEEDKVVCRLTLRGTQAGEFLGVAATGEQITAALISIIRIADRKIVERWSISDQLGLMQQLAVVPPPG